MYSPAVSGLAIVNNAVWLDVVPFEDRNIDQPLMPSGATKIKADITSLDHVSAREQRRRHFETERPGRLQINNKLEFR